MKYKIGDKVKLRADISGCHSSKYAGCIGTITTVGSNYYLIDLDNEIFVWADKHIECKVDELEKKVTKFRVGDRVKCVITDGSLVVGKVYTITYVYPNTECYDIDDKNDCYHYTRFEKVNPFAGDVTAVFSDSGLQLEFKETFNDFMSVVDTEKTISSTLKSALGICNNEENKMVVENDKMELKNIKKTNLKEAKKQILEEKRNAEIVFAKNEYRYAIDSSDKIDRAIKELEEEKKQYTDIIKQFEGK